MLLVRVSDMPIEIRKTLINFPRVQPNAWLFTEANAYRLLLRGHAAGCEPFRKWVTEEVLPGVRKTGQYDTAKSITLEATQFADEFSQMRGMIENLTTGVMSLKDIIEGLTGGVKAE
ncbi:hypothetical protein HA39_03205 [Pantoea brenneri]|nr:hypothetical protein HA39_03205 [Pantoea brenneri]